LTKNKLVLPNHDFFEEVMKLLNQKRQVSLMVKGTSMKPFLDEETEVFLRQFDSYHKGDICLFKFNNKYLLHRIKRVVGKDYVFRGDNTVKSETVEFEAIYGRVTYYMKKAKKHKPWNFNVSLKLFFYRVYLKLRTFGKKILRKKG